ncbi:putative neuropeptide Y receptor type 6 [Clytia hemisphaerica]|uniref:putative neuropeptide Y receptor type 6 n=1 Tax=Clytia hemisphaerica TaxID=252671 RepID=UPI0034D634D3
METSFILEQFCAVFEDIISKENCTCRNPEVFQVVPSCADGIHSSTTPIVIRRQTDDFAFRIGYSSISILLGVFGLLCNSYIVTKPGRKWKELANSQRLILYLAITNIFYTIIFLIRTSTNFLSSSWILGDPLCKLFMSIAPVGSSLSIGFVAIIAYERFVGITRPLSSLTNRILSILTLINIVISFGTTIPNFLYTGLQQNGKCEQKWPSDVFGLIYNTLYLLIPTLTTVSITTFFYYKINITLKNAIFKDNFLQNSIQKKSYEHKVKQTLRIGKIIKFIILTFGIMVPPYQVCYIILLATGYVNMTLFKILTFIAVPIYQAHVVLHPFLFSGMHKEVNRWFRSLFRRARKHLGISKASYVVNGNTTQVSRTTEASCISESSRTDSFNDES